MKLNIVPARAGVQWVKLGIQTFFRQPLALSGLFFMFMAILSVTTLLPYVGSALALALLPAATLGLMAATQEAAKGKFPMPSILISAFRAGQQRLRAALLDGGKFAMLYLVGGQITREQLAAEDFQRAMWVALALYLPLSLLFWHAPALVHWHGVPPTKSLFFSMVACLRNFKAFVLYGLMWLGVFVLGSLIITLFAALIGSPQAVGLAMVPAALLMAAMFFSSIYFSFRDSFVDDTHSQTHSEPKADSLP
jgi:hypothetical protein